MTEREADDNLATYLNEHLLGSEGGVRAFHAAGRTWAGTPHEAALHALADEVARDRKDLAQLIQRLGFRPAGWKRALTLAVSAVGAANPVNLLRLRRSSMAQLELDVLTGMVRAKLSMWDALLEVAEHDRRFDVRMLEALKLRAEQQIAELQRISRETAHERFG
ncbi:hypothetical protein [Agrococcus carbonis]|uniref:Rubrerythrin n=1 Tax=Agrococcus carbonis TaxID=684552 RepID=A0A1H1PXN3_9MICO|nr:hypothetical protein [Agrococcus carbonis]SDS16131.1 hypothetical protein SAMN04489719_1680 [Agrococcus carbonis]